MVAEVAAPCGGGLRNPGNAIPGVQALEPKALGNTAQDLVLPPGQVEAGRTQGSKDTPATGIPELCRAAPPIGSIQAPADWETAVVTAGADSRAGELTAATVVVPSAVTLGLD